MHEFTHKFKILDSINEFLDVTTLSMNNPKACEILRKSKDLILQEWESKSRKVVSATAGKDSSTIRNELRLFLDSLQSLLENSESKDASIDKAENSAQLHGQQRSGLTGYNLLQVIEEYSILREVIIQFLAPAELSEKERRIIHKAVDHALQVAANEFAQAEKSGIKLALAKAEASNRDLDQFSAVAAHDLRSPLNAIAGFASVLKEELGNEVNEDITKSLDYIDQAVNRMITLIEGILSYAKLNSNGEEREEVSCDEAVSSATQNLKSLLTSSSGRIGHDPLPTVMGSLPLLSQLFQNLFANSIKFKSNKPPEINISVKSDSDFWIFSVSDNGEGFDPKFKEVIFQVHKQLDSGARLEGVGLGLATCRRVLELHGGKIWAESQIGQGSTFYFSLPKILNS